MPHWKKMMDPKEMLFAFDLDGRDVTLTIKKVVAGELTGEQGRKSKKPIIHFEKTPKKLAANNTNCKTIAQLFGSHETNDWVGKRITLFPTTTNFGGNTVDCIRVRPYLPKDKTDGTIRDAAPPPGEEPSAAQIEAEIVAAEAAAGAKSGAAS
jgi:hypothetical protein